ncbi:D-alanyl-D-alanine carboxypeptidase/D-alanyl-D-alanine-endopeptidase [Anaerohalosphaera lusitana]|nr:D-alanyl-D-alanine carboxypeptidase/D-alanyl-D-alanine-endopeptidase [Anaerohalosphaera lusitana]
MFERIQKEKFSRRAFFVLIFALASATYAGVNSQITQILNRKHCSGVDFAIKIVDADSGGLLYEQNSEEPMTPASNMKLVTTAAALHYLGPEYEFRTRLCMAGSNVVVVGGGDPLLGDRELARSYDKDPDWVVDDMVKRIKERSIESVNDIILDSTFFDDNRVHPKWPVDQLNRSYAAEVSGLSYSNNCVRMTVSRKSSRVYINVDPVSNYLDLINQVKATSSGSSAAGAYRCNIPNKLYVKGRCRTSTGFDVAIERPALFFGAVLKKKLEEAGIDVRGSIYEKYCKRDPEIEIVAEYRTPLLDVLKRCNKDSLNMAAESLVKTISAENTTGKVNGEWEHGLVLIGRYLNSLGIDGSEFVLDDGCGLSRENRISTNAIVSVLENIRQRGRWNYFRQTLAVGGVDGTIRKYFRQAKYKGKIVGKTGYIRGVRAFSGVVETENGDFLFSILTEGGSSYVRRAINDISEVIVDNAG